jgi:hypothetical protein
MPARQIRRRNTITVSVSSNYGMFGLKTGSDDNDRHSLHIGNVTGILTPSTQSIEIQEQCKRGPWWSFLGPRQRRDHYFFQKRPAIEEILDVLAFMLTNCKRQPARLATIELRMSQDQLTLPHAHRWHFLQSGCLARFRRSDMPALCRKSQGSTVSRHLSRLMNVIVRLLLEIRPWDQP